MRPPARASHPGGQPEFPAHLEAKEMALQPEGYHLQDDAQQHRDDVEDSVDGPLQDLLLVDVLTSGIEVEDGSRNQDRHQLEGPEHLQGVSYCVYYVLCRVCHRIITLTFSTAME